MGHERRFDRGVPAEGVAPCDAGDVHQGRHAGQAGAQGRHSVILWDICHHIPYLGSSIHHFAMHIS